MGAPAKKGNLKESESVARENHTYQPRKAENEKEEEVDMPG